MQLINSAIYDKEAQARTKAIAETQKAKVEKRAKLEEAKVIRYAQGNTQPVSASSQAAVTTNRPSSYRIFVNHIPFQVAQGGSKLIKQSSTRSPSRRLRFRKVILTHLRRSIDCEYNAQKGSCWWRHIRSKQKRQPTSARCSRVEKVFWRQYRTLYRTSNSTCQQEARQSQEKR
jgi:hypothetical protein